MAVPILKLGPNLIACIQAALDDADMLLLRDDLVRMVGEVSARGVVIDVSAMDVMDSYATRMLRTIVQMTGLRGARSIVVGVQPEVAFSMVQLGLSLQGVETAVDLEDALARLEGEA